LRKETDFLSVQLDLLKLQRFSQLVEDALILDEYRKVLAEPFFA
jgi:hypothetical protein